MLRRVFAVIVILLAVLLRPTLGEEGMYPITSLAKLNLKAKGLKIDPASIYNPKGRSLIEAVVQLERVHRLVRLARRPDHHQSPLRLRRRAGGEQRGEGLPDQRLPGEGADRGDPGARHDCPDHRGDARRDLRRHERREGRDGPDRAGEGNRCADRGTDQAGAEGPAGQDHRDLRDAGREVLRDVHLDDAARRPPGLRAAPVHWRVRRRGRQLGVAASHWRLLLRAGLRRARREAGRATRRPTCPTTRSGSSR